jgi:hypothetical protein
MGIEMLCLIGTQDLGTNSTWLRNVEGNGND